MIKIGERVTLPDGTYVCRVAKNIHIGVCFENSLFEDWQDDKFKIKARPDGTIDTESLDWAGGPNNDSWQICIEGEWRSI